jgi:hypothetical protein
MIVWGREEDSMKRYLIFATVGPLFGGLLLLFARTVASGYWIETIWPQVGNFLVIFAKTFHYSYLFLVVQALMVGAIDDILLHVREMRPLVRMLIVGAAGFAAGELLHGLRGPDSGVVQFILHGLSGFIPAMISSSLAHKFAEQPQAPTYSLEDSRGS